jgi:hypothetical protein
VDESVDEGDDGGGVGKDLAPGGKGLVGGEQDRALEVSAGDDLEEQVGVAGIVGEVADLIDGE